MKKMSDKLSVQIFVENEGKFVDWSMLDTAMQAKLSENLTQNACPQNMMIYRLKNGEWKPT